MTIFTIGHSTRSIDDFAGLLRRPGVTRVWDIRRYPGSRRYPHFNSEALAAQPTAIMCSEAVPWRCHRSLVSDALIAKGVEVQHILDTKTSPHRLTSFAVVDGEEVSYPRTGELGQEELDINPK